MGIDGRVLLGGEIGPEDWWGFKQQPFSDYAAVRAINHGLLGKIDPLRSGAPALALADLRGELPNATSDAMTWGSAVHTAVLEPDVFDESFVASGQCTATKGNGQRCTNDGRRLNLEKGWLCGVHAKADAGDDSKWNDGATVLTQTDYDACLRARDQALVHHEEAREILAPIGFDMDREVTGVWRDEETEYRCKLRGDNVDDVTATLTDVKTTRNASPDAFRRSLWDFAIYRQLAWYDSGFEALDRRMRSHIIVAVERRYPNLVAVYRVPEYLITMGRREAHALKRKLVECDQSNDWPSFTEGIVTLDLNRWDMTKLVDLYGELENAQ